MISFVLGKPPMVNSKVTFRPGQTDADEHPAFTKRDAIGDLTVTLDALVPEDGTSVLFENTEEKRSQYLGRIVHGAKGALTFAPNSPE